MRDCPTEGLALQDMGELHPFISLTIPSVIHTPSAHLEILLWPKTRESCQRTDPQLLTNPALWLTQGQLDKRGAIWPEYSISKFNENDVVPSRLQ